VYSSLKTGFSALLQNSKGKWVIITNRLNKQLLTL